MKQTTLQFEKPILEILRPLPKTNRKKIKNKTKTAEIRQFIFLTSN